MDQHGGAWLDIGATPGEALARALVAASTRADTITLPHGSIIPRGVWGSP